MNKEETRKINQRDTKSLNRVGDRLKWIRGITNLKQSDVSKETGIPASSYSARENGSRSINHDEFLVLAKLFNSKWPTTTQFYNGTAVSKITASFIMFGVYE